MQCIKCIIGDFIESLWRCCTCFLFKYLERFLCHRQGSSDSSFLDTPLVIKCCPLMVWSSRSLLNTVQNHYLSPTTIPRWIYRFSSDHRSQAASGPVSTWMGDRLGIPGVVGFLLLFPPPKSPFTSKFDNCIIFPFLIRVIFLLSSFDLIY